ncbi:MAG: glutamine--fructose-6-phosphate transaminase (isomerizing) [Clostridia bacterium]|nr:glutamine--fructose-6-phosphate transaminase (isomerizing) [Clostridia bacterium]
MCGIVGYIGKQKAAPILLAGLAKLEYRGYDSAGIAIMENGNIEVQKDKGRVSNLCEIKEIENLQGSIGIAHTRWATHGEPSKTNAHPHTDSKEDFAVVHNGIIENYVELRKELEGNDYNFKSETDTEVIPNLIHYFYSKDSKNDELKLVRAVKQATDKLIGSFAIEVLSKENPDIMVVVRKDSPLVIGKGYNENYIASDIPAILSYTKDFYLLENLEFAMLSRDSIRFFDKDLKEFNKKSDTITWNAMAADKNGYEDYMLKEIYEQPTAIRETIGTRVNEGTCKFDELNFTKEYLLGLNQIYIVACGTAMHVGLAVKSTIERLSKIHTEVDIASEFRYRKPLVDEKTLCIFITQSGETADTIAALKLCKEKGAKTLAVTNVIGSSITREADFSIYTHAGPEIAVASTKAYTSQITLLVLLAMYFAQILGTMEKQELENIIKEMLVLPNKLEEVLKISEQIKEIAKQMYKEKDVFYLGRGIDYATAQEASLKVKEISYIHSESYAAGELKHGTIALIEKGINVIGIMTDPNLVKKTVSNIEEIITRGAITTVVINEKIAQMLDTSIFTNVVKVPETEEFLSPIITVVPLQLLAYYISKEKGLDVDKPRNLAKSVTVE